MDDLSSVFFRLDASMWLRILQRSTGGATHPACKPSRLNSTQLNQSLLQ